MQREHLKMMPCCSVSIDNHSKMNHKNSYLIQLIHAYYKNEII